MNVAQQKRWAMTDDIQKCFFLESVKECKLKQAYIMWHVVKLSSAVLKYSIVYNGRLCFITFSLSLLFSACLKHTLCFSSPNIACSHFKRLSTAAVLLSPSAPPPSSTPCQTPGKTFVKHLSNTMSGKTFVTTFVADRH